MKLFDTHCHLTDPRFDEDRKQTIERMQAAGVARALVVGDGSQEEQPVFELARRYDWMSASTGVHPHDASCWSEETARRIERWMGDEKAVALGEIGLDYHYDLSPREVQRAAFEAQLDLAYRLNKPVILHVREAHGDATDILNAFRRASRLPRGVMHCYTGSWESAKTYLDMGLYISFSGAATFKNIPKLGEVVVNLPLDRLLLETDCPYMAPVPLRGQRNEPAFIEHTARRVAELRGMDEDELAAAAYDNGCRLFGL